MNKAILILAIFAICLTPNVLSANIRGTEEKDRELTQIGSNINLGNLGNIIGDIIGALKNNTSSSHNASNSTTVANNTSSNNNSSSSTTPVVNNTQPDNGSQPVSNNTSSTPVTNSTTTPVVNNTQPANNTSSNNNNSSPSTNATVNSTQPVTNNTQPVDSNSTTNSTTNTTTPTTPAAPVKYARNDVLMSSFPSDCLFLHNRERGFVGLNNLTWSDSLAASAQAWAENMAVNGFRHSGKTGENIASTTYSTKTLGRLLGLWINEKYHYIPGCTYGHCSTTSAEVGHYTQMVWHSTTQVGCGFAPGVNKDYNYLCCQYYKAGNIIGQEVYPYPVPNNTNTNA